VYRLCWSSLQRTRSRDCGSPVFFHWSALKIHGEYFVSVVYRTCRRVSSDFK
jgi:hypothetical protein